MHWTHYVKLVNTSNYNTSPSTVNIHNTLHIHVDNYYLQLRALVLTSVNAYRIFKFLFTYTVYIIIILSMIIIYIFFIYVYRILFMFIDHNKHTLVKKHVCRSQRRNGRDMRSRRRPITRQLEVRRVRATLP